MIHACYEIVLAMVSFMNMSYFYFYDYLVMQCLVVSESSSQRCLHNSIYAMPSFFAKSESVNETCYVYMGAILSCDPFWLIVRKGLLLHALSRVMPCIVLLLYVPVECCYLALNIAS